MLRPLAIAFVVALLSGLVAGEAALAAPPVRPTVAIGHAPAPPSGATPLGRQSDRTPLDLVVTLAPRDPAALASFASAVSTPGSPEFRRYLAPHEFAKAFGPTTETLDGVGQGLRGLGLTSGRVASNHLSIDVRTTVGAAADALHTGFETYRLRAGRVAFANTAAPRLPASLAGVVQSVIGLDSLRQAVPAGGPVPSSNARSRLGPEVVTGGPQPCTKARSTGGYTADDLASAYRFDGLYGEGDLGSGATVGLFELEPNRPSDIAKYQTCYGTSASVSYVKVGKGSGKGPGYGEAALDIEDVIGLAPQANLLVYDAPNSASGFYKDWSAIVTDDQAQVVSTSWLECEQYVGENASSENTLLEQAAAQGQTIVAADGDYGSESCDQFDGGTYLSVDDSASQPFATGVGGTALSSIGPPPTESVWNDFDGSGGGGISALWPMPSYQSGAPSTLHVVNVNSSKKPCGVKGHHYCREVPDVSADAQENYVVYHSGDSFGPWEIWYGTSAATPLWGALIALADESSACAGTPLGFLNPALYSVAAGSNHAKALNDVTVGNNDFTGTNGGLYPATSGYDMASGLGTPVAWSSSGHGLAAQLCAIG